jgi:hypothetical protein
LPKMNGGAVAMTSANPLKLQNHSCIILPKTLSSRQNLCHPPYPK